MLTLPAYQNDTQAAKAIKEEAEAQYAAMIREVEAHYPTQAYTLEQSPRGKYA